MKYLIFVIGWVLPFAAHAMDCTSDSAMSAAQTALLNAYDGNDPAEVAISNVQHGTLPDGTPVCIGQVQTPKFTTFAMWVTVGAGGAEQASILQAVDPTHFTLSAAAQQQQDQQEAQSAAGSLAWQQKVQNAQQQDGQRSNPSLGSVLFGNGLNSLLKGQ
jgi:hypothetical protein